MVIWLLLVIVSITLVSKNNHKVKNHRMDVNEYQNTGLPIARPPSGFAVEKYRCQTKTEDSKRKKEQQEKFDNENPDCGYYQIKER